LRVGGGVVAYQDQNVSISLQQIRMNGQVFPPSFVRSVTVCDTSFQHRISMCILAIGAMVLAIFLSGQRGAGNGVLIMCGLVALFGYLAYWHTKYPNLELRVILHSGGGDTALAGHDLSA
jgi:hypothetical protein